MATDEDSDIEPHNSLPATRITRRYFSMQKFTEMDLLIWQQTAIV
jgi:hypothetical protein